MEIDMPWDILFGGITGLAGTIWSSWNQRKIRELDMKDRAQGREHELKLVQAESQAMLAETEANIRVARVQTEGALHLAETEAYAAHLIVANKPTLSTALAGKLFSTTGWVAILAQPAGVFICILFGLVDTVKGFARPGITLYLLILSTWISRRAWSILESSGGALTTTQSAEIVTQVTCSLLYLTTTAVCWWFGDRMAAKGAARLISPQSHSEGTIK
ncbi:unknown protein [Desulfotalea psychrophila LSv54]|uniref:Uncharacterized protein n=2 Tax=Desulfotalea psychrophila TaxID=84980 RepID=Q6ALN7_DESPS|nr:unknown protein [Desulfotalea psychrophila LSv54]